MFDLFPQPDYSGLVAMMKESDDFMTYKYGPVYLMANEDVNKMSDEDAKSSFLSELNSLLSKYGATLVMNKSPEKKENLSIESRKFHIDTSEELSKFVVNKSIQYAYIPRYPVFVQVEVNSMKDSNNASFRIKKIFYLSQNESKKNTPKKVEKYFSQNNKSMIFVDTHEKAYNAIIGYGNEYSCGYSGKEYSYSNKITGSGNASFN